MAITLAASDHMVDVAVNQCKEILGMIFARFVKGKPLKHTDVAFAKCLCGIDGKVEQFGERFGGLDRAFEVAGVDSVDALGCKMAGGDLGLGAAEVRKRSGPLAAEAPFGVSGGLPVPDQI